MFLLEVLTYEKMARLLGKYLEMGLVGGMASIPLTL